MVAASVLPIAKHNNKIYFLFGRESDEDETPGFSDFGGGIKPGENTFSAAFREFTEETTGIFGGAEESMKKAQHCEIYKIIHGKDEKAYNIYVVPFEYDTTVVKHYNNIQKFIHDSIKDKNFLHKTAIFEKIEMCWMTREEALKRKKEFRSFYREILDKIMGEEFKKIKKIIAVGSSFGNNKKTRRRR
jgi:hypothetical protein